MDQRPEPYWMVHCPTQGPASAVHPSRESAEREAKRLAQSCPGHVFYVLQTMAARFVPEPVERVDFELPEIPF